MVNLHRPNCFHIYVLLYQPVIIIFHSIPFRIAIFRNAEKVPPNEHTIVQEYIDKPFLVDGFKCDMRIYVLVTSCDPLRIFLYQDGLLRMGTERYSHPTESNAVSIISNVP